MIWFLIFYLAGFAATMMTLAAQSRSVVHGLVATNRGGRPIQIIKWRLPPHRIAVAALAWFVTIPLGLYIARQLHLMGGRFND